MKKRHSLIERIISVILLIAMLGTTILPELSVTTVYASEAAQEDAVSPMSEEDGEKAAAEADTDSGKDASQKDESASEKDDTESGKDDVSAGKDNSSADTSDSTSGDTSKDDADKSETKDNTSESRTGDDKNSSGSSAVNGDAINKDAENGSTTDAPASEEVVPEMSGDVVPESGLMELEEDAAWRESTQPVPLPGNGTADDPYRLYGAIGLEKLAHNIAYGEFYSRGLYFAVYQDTAADSKTIDLTGQTWQIGTHSKGAATYFYGTIRFQTDIRINTDHPLFGVLGGGARINEYTAEISTYANLNNNSKYWGGLAEEIRYGNPDTTNTEVVIDTPYMDVNNLEIHEDTLMAAGALVGHVYNDASNKVSVKISQPSIVGKMYINAKQAVGGLIGSVDTKNTSEKKGNDAFGSLKVDNINYPNKITIESAAMAGLGVDNLSNNGCAGGLIGNTAFGSEVIFTGKSNTFMAYDEFVHLRDVVIL